MKEAELDATLGVPLIREVPASRYAPATKLGDLVRITEPYGYTNPKPAGTMGKVIFIDDQDTVIIQIANGEKLELVPHIDRWEVSR